MSTSARTQSSSAVPWGPRFAGLALEHPDKPAVIFVSRQGHTERVVTWDELERTSNRMAHLMSARGIGSESMVCIALPNVPEHLMLGIAIWKLGSCVLPLNPLMPGPERTAILETVRPNLVVSEWSDSNSASSIMQSELHDLGMWSDATLPTKIAHPGKAIASGGSTGRPKIIVDPRAWVRVPGFAYGAIGRDTGWHIGMTQLITTRLYHNLGFLLSHFGLFDDHTIVLMEHFDAERAVDLINEHRVSYIAMAPIIMQRIAQLPGLSSQSFSSIRSVYHSGAACPPWVKRAWISFVGAEHVWEGFGATESIGATMIRGDDWLMHPGTVGRPHESELRILDEHLIDVPNGVVGEIFVKRLSGELTYRYIGAAPLRTTPDGFSTVGDLGWLDEDGYLHLADRRADLIITGGANVYPAEVEGVLSEHPSVVDVVVVPVPDHDWGQRVHAIIQPRDMKHVPSNLELDRFCRAHLSSYKVPKTYEFVAVLEREETGKLRRSALAAARRDQS